MHNENFFTQAFIYLMAAVVSVPIAKKLGLGSVLGYLLAGIVIGPYVLRLIGTEGDDVMHIAEFGVVIMLFLIGLELRPSLLWKLRRSIFGLGGLQVLLTTTIIGGISLFIGLSITQSIGVGLILSLSSTAIVLQTLAEKNLLKTTAGQASFSVLLFQDIAVIPILAILPLLATKNQNVPNNIISEEVHTVAETDVLALTGLQQLLLIIGLVLFIIVAGRFIARYIFRFIAATGIREIFTAAALLIIISIALAMDKVGLSPALGTFLAGVVLADSEYRHELEADVEPFKGLLLGLFFIAVGAGIDFNLLFQKPVMVLVILLGLISVKFLVLFVLGRFFKLRNGKETQLAMTLAQGGEFAFVLISFSQGVNLFPDEWSSLLVLSVALSMAITPILLIINEKVIQPLYEKVVNEPKSDEIAENDNKVIIAGFGRFGVVIGRLLFANGIQATVLDNNPKNIQILRKFGLKVYYGDASRPDLLKSAGADKAKLLIMAIDDKEKALETAKYIKRTYPNLKIVARAVDLKHLYEYYNLEITDVQVEVFDSALELGVLAMQRLGFSNYQSYRAAQTFKKHNKDILADMYIHWLEDKDKYIQQAQRYTKELEEMFEAERTASIHESDSAWDTATLREEVKEQYSNRKEEK